MSDIKYKQNPNGIISTRAMEGLQADSSKLAATVEYVAMMADVDIDYDEQEVNGYEQD